MFRIDESCLLRRGLTRWNIDVQRICISRGGSIWWCPFRVFRGCHVWRAEVARKHCFSDLVRAKQHGGYRVMFGVEGEFEGSSASRRESG